MSKVTVGSKMPDFTFDTAYENGLTLSQVARKAKKTAVVFLRYYGCPVCQMDIHNFAKEYEKVTALGCQLLVGLQSKQSTITGQMEKGDVPFDFILDPEQEIYKLLEIGSQEGDFDFASITDPKILAKFAAVREGGYQHGEYEGNEAQLPATFILDPDMNVSYVHYGTWGGDTPNTDELVELLK